MESSRHNSGDGGGGRTSRLSQEAKSQSSDQPLVHYFLISFSLEQTFFGDVPAQPPGEDRAWVLTYWSKWKDARASVDLASDPKSHSVCLAEGRQERKQKEQVGGIGMGGGGRSWDPDMFTKESGRIY